MGKGRAPCCDKEKVKRGPWSPSEDFRLITFVQKHGHQNWRALPKQAGLLRCGKSCRLRWINYLRPDVRRGNFTKDEEDTIIRLHATLGNKWSKIASYFPGRTDNEIKNVWNTHLKKRLGSTNGNVDKKDESMTTSSSSSCVTSMSSFNDKKPNETFEMVVVLDKANHGSPFEEPEALSSSSISSNITNSNEVNVLNPEIQEDLLFNFTGCYYNTSEEVNKPETAFDIPLESDLEFWNMLDSLGSFQSKETQSHNETQSPNFGEAENNKWLLYLEQELGLEPKDGGFEAEPLLVPEMNGMDTMDHYHNTVQPYESNSKQ